MMIFVFLFLQLVVSTSNVQQRCDFPVVDNSRLSDEFFYQEAVLKSTPILVTNAMKYSDGSSWKGLIEWKWNKIISVFPEAFFRFGQGPYPKDQITIADYVDSNVSSSESIFQYGQVPTSWSLWGHRRECIEKITHFYPHSRPMHENISILCDIFSSIELPRFLSGDSESKTSTMITHSGFLIGKKSTGIDFHKHQDAINLIFDGRKQWFIKVPKSSTNYEHLLSTCVNNRAETDSLIHEVCFSDLGKFSEILNTTQFTEEAEDDSKILTCEQHEGEIIYIPNEFQHAVYNLDNTIAMQMQWYRGDYRNNDVKRYLYQYLLNSLNSDKFPLPDSFDDIEELKAEQAKYSKFSPSQFLF